ncbi:MAG TPA: phosphoribosylanthranilate isomerase [Chloroflexota bacterium]|nr:phosphoribosylanthranilate isomerase [Chloroflexota bacterium]
MTRVKICGIRRVDDAVAAVGAGADMLGFVFAPSRRRIDPEAARDIVVEARHHGSARMVGVFVDEPAAEIERIAQACELDYVQLSGDEPDAVLRALSYPTIKALHVSAATTPEELVARADAIAADMLLLDTAAQGLRGGSGVPFDWSVIPRLDRPVLLAGGLHAGNVREAIDRAHPWGVDVSSGVETGGEKDPYRIHEFVRRVHRSAG